MDVALFYAWAAGFTLPPSTLPKPADRPAPVKRRGKKAARQKRMKAEK